MEKLFNAGKTIYTIFTRQILSSNLRLSLGSENINVSKRGKIFRTLPHLLFDLDKSCQQNRKLQQRINMLRYLKAKNILVLNYFVSKKNNGKTTIHVCKCSLGNCNKI